MRVLIPQRFGLELHEKVPSADDFEKQYTKAFCARIEKKISKEFSRLKVFKSMAGELLGLLQVRLRSNHLVHAARHFVQHSNSSRQYVSSLARLFLYRFSVFLSQKLHASGKLKFYRPKSAAATADASAINLVFGHQDATGAHNIVFFRDALTPGPPTQAAAAAAEPEHAPGSTSVSAAGAASGDAKDAKDAKPDMKRAPTVGGKPGVQRAGSVPTANKAGATSPTGAKNASSPSAAAKPAAAAAAKPAAASPNAKSGAAPAAKAPAAAPELKKQASATPAKKK